MKLLPSRYCYRYGTSSSLEQSVLGSPVTSEFQNFAFVLGLVDAVLRRLVNTLVARVDAYDRGGAIVGFKGAVRRMQKNRTC